MHPWLDFRGSNGCAKISQFDPQGLVLYVDKRDVVWLDVSVQDTNIPEGVQSHQQLQGQNKKTSLGFGFPCAAVFRIRIRVRVFVIDE